MHCSGEGLNITDFKCMSDDACLQMGGQCKSEKTSHYVRGPTSEPLWLAAKSDGPEQVHLIGGSPDEVAVYWMTPKPKKTEVQVREKGATDTKTYKGTRDMYSAQLLAGGSNGWIHPFHGECRPPEDPNGCIYQSGVIHTVQVTGLVGGTKYEYQLPGEDSWREFKTPPAVGQPIAFGVTADLGQTKDSQRTLDHMQLLASKGELDHVIFPGDVAYSDGYAPAWDSFGRVVEPLMSRVPTAIGGGDHELGGDGGSWMHFEKRFGWRNKERSGSDSFLWFSWEAGLAHITMLCSFCDHKVGSLQHDWLLEDLKTVDRSRTPWLIVAFHVPFYNTMKHHGTEESDPMRRAMEEIFYKNKVDIILDGHIHMYERTLPMYNLTEDCAGPVHFMVGDGGNHEGPTCGGFKGPQPSWSAYREFSYGHGLLTLKDADHASWKWHRNQDGEDMSNAADEFAIERASQRCSKAVSTEEALHASIV